MLSMKKITELIRESQVTNDYIEDCLIHFEDMGFKIAEFDNVSSRKRKSNLFTSGDISEGHLYSFEPTEGNNYVCHFITLSKSMRRYSDDQVWSQVVTEMNSFKRKLTRCEVYYTINSGQEINITLDRETEFKIHIFVIDKSERIDPAVISKLEKLRSEIWEFIGRNVDGKRLYNHSSFLWTKNSLLWSIALFEKTPGSKGEMRRNKSIDAAYRFLEERGVKFQDRIEDSEYTSGRQNLVIEITI